ncbi:MAG: DUF560 domain-containing protein [Burkholderiales bacterium]|nr:MAG: DUF560 domain-containing protein [Burkholderiales bacterium]
MEAPPRHRQRATRAALALCVSALLALAPALIDSAHAGGTAAANRSGAAAESLRWLLAQAPPAAAEDGRGAAGPSPLGALLSEARARLRRGDAAAAYRLLAERESLYAGFPEYDFLLGLAAIDAGKPARAVFALERVLAAEPGHLRARAEIARAHFLLGEMDASRRQFETVASQAIPGAVRDTIGRYLDAIEHLSTAQRPQTTAYLALSTGYDSNVNLGSSLREWIGTGGLRLLPEATSLAQDGSFVRFGAGVERVVPLDDRWQWYAKAAFEQRLNSVRRDTELGTVDLSAGLGYREDCHRMSLTAQLQHARLERAAFRNAAGITAQWQCESAARTRAGGYAQAFRLLFPEQSDRDARRLQVGAVMARGFDSAREPVLIGSAYAGVERSSRDLAEYDFDFVGLRFVSEVTLLPGWRGYAGVSYEHRSFDGVNPLFAGLRRTDRDLELQIGVEHPVGDWTITPAAVLTRVWSTIDPNDYRRAQIYLHARYRFR